jgi:large subunit ribosomal protein L4e
MRNRRYVKRRGPLVIYYDENAGIKFAVRNLTGVDVCPASRLNLLQLAPGGHMGRLCIWAKSAFGQLGTIYGTQSEPSSTKNQPLGKPAYTPPKSMMANPDVGRILNSDEVQSVVNAAKPPTDFKSNKNKPNTAKNVEALAALNPYAATFKKLKAGAANTKAPKKRGGKLTKEQKAVKRATSASTSLLAVRSTKT